MMKYTVIGTKTFDVTFIVEAEDEQEARDAFDSTDCMVEITDDDVIVDSCYECTSEIDDVICDAEEKWNDLEKSERMEILKGNGVSDDSAYEIAGRDFDSIPDEWKEFFE